MTSLIILFLGASIGSFAYAFAFRFPRKSDWIFGKSQCDECGKRLFWYELVPLASFIIQKGKCRNCLKFIGWGYLFSELFMSLSFLFLWNSFIIGPRHDYMDLLFRGAFLIFFFIIALIDLKYFIIPDKLLILGGILAVGFGLYSGPNFSVLNSVMTALIVGGIFFLVWLVSKGKWIGFGDVKFILLIGFLFGFPGTVFIFYIAVFMGVVVSIYLLILKKANRKTPLPFGTFLAISSILYLIFASKIDSFFIQILL